MKLKASICSLLLMSPIAVASDYYQACNGILVNGVIETYESTNSYDARIALKKWLCSHESGSNGGGGNLELDVIGIFTLGGGGQGVDSWKREHCAGTDYDYEGSRSSHILIQHASDAVVNAWSTCIKDIRPENLACYAEETHDSLLMKVDLQYGIGDIVNTDVVGTNMTALNNIPQKFRPGRTNLRYEIDDKNREAYFDMNGEADYINVSCSYTVPPKPVSEDGDAGCEEFRLQSLAKGKITYYDYLYLRDTNQVPLFSSDNGAFAGYYACSLFE